MSKRKNVDIRMLYILPSLLALVLAITCFIYQFGNEFVDMRNTCYTIYASVPEGMSDEEMLEEYNSFLLGYDLTGFTLNKNTQGAVVVDGKLSLDNSYRIDLMNISKKTAFKIADDLHTEYNINVMVQESVVKITYFM